MLLTHAIALAEARSYLAALADQARTLPATVAYDDALLYFDAIHNDRVPALELLSRVNPAVLHELTEEALLDLVQFGFDPLHLELVLAMIHDASSRDTTSTLPDPNGNQP